MNRMDSNKRMRWRIFSFFYSLKEFLLFCIFIEQNFCFRVPSSATISAYVLLVTCGFSTVFPSVNITVSNFSIISLSSTVWFFCILNWDAEWIATKMKTKTNACWEIKTSLKMKSTLLKETYSRKNRSPMNKCITNQSGFDYMCAHE